MLLLPQHPLLAHRCGGLVRLRFHCHCVTSTFCCTKVLKAPLSEGLLVFPGRLCGTGKLEEACSQAVSHLQQR